ncbi:MAG: hypothetical protein IKV63_02865 [Clostridia bacterium]|nr:hypothetical protein [Clostridia bacterium]
MNKIFIAASLLVALAVSFVFGFERTTPVSDSAIMGNTVSVPTENVMTEDEILDVIDECISRWRAGDLSAEMAILTLNEWTGNEDKDISKAALDGIKLITVETDAKVYRADAEVSFEKGDYVDAIRNILKIDTTYSDWSQCSALLVSCKKAIYEAVSKVETIEDHEKYVALLDEYLTLVDDAVMSNKLDDLEEALIQLKDIEEILTLAESDFYGENYGKALSDLEEAVKKYPDSDEIKAVLQEYRSEYVTYITEEVKLLCDEKKYDEAEAMADEAVAQYECDEFAALQEYVKEQRSFINRFKRGFREAFRPFFR